LAGSRGKKHKKETGIKSLKRIVGPPRIGQSFTGEGEKGGKNLRKKGGGI